MFFFGVPVGRGGRLASLTTGLRLAACVPFRQQAFSTEVAGVERGLYIQLGEAGAKTEAQLGEQQLEAAKRLRHLLITNR